MIAAAAVGGRSACGAALRRALGHESGGLACRCTGGLVPHQGTKIYHVNVLEIDAFVVVEAAVVLGSYSCWRYGGEGGYVRGGGKRLEHR